MKCNQTFSKTFNVKEKIYNAKIGTIVCYKGNSEIAFYVCEKDNEPYILNENFPYLAFCGNIFEGTHDVKAVMKFLKTHGAEVSGIYILEVIQDFKIEHNLI